jgi:hypothetical protein
MSNGGNNESKKAKKEKIKPIGVPINIAVQEPILSSFVVFMLSCFKYLIFLLTQGKINYKKKGILIYFK